MFYEIRTYQSQPGRRDEWVEYMERVVIPFQTSKGMDVVASFVDEENEDAYIWIRRFDDEQQRKERYAAVYQDDRWKNEIAPVVVQLLRIELEAVVRAVPTSRSPLS